MTIIIRNTKTYKLLTPTIYPTSDFNEDSKYERHSVTEFVSPLRPEENATRNENMEGYKHIKNRHFTLSLFIISSKLYTSPTCKYKTSHSSQWSSIDKELKFDAKLLLAAQLNKYLTKNNRKLSVLMYQLSTINKPSFILLPSPSFKSSPVFPSHPRLRFS